MERQIGANMFGDQETIQLTDAGKQLVKAVRLMIRTLPDRLRALRSERRDRGLDGSVVRIHHASQQVLDELTNDIMEARYLNTHFNGLRSIYADETPCRCGSGLSEDECVAEAVRRGDERRAMEAADRQQAQ